MHTVSRIFLNTLPVLVMVGLILFIANEYVLTGLYLLITIIVLVLRRSQNDILIFFFGLVVMTISEYLFVSTGVETFTQHTLFGMMPLWLPVLWGYGFVAIKRSVEIL